MGDLTTAMSLWGRGGGGRMVLSVSEALELWAAREVCLLCSLLTSTLL